MNIMKKEIKIFLASSNELADERDKIDLWISKKSKSLESQGFKLTLIRWEDLSHHVRAERVQNDFTQEMLKCDIVVIVFKKKVGPFTREEFDQAYAHLKEHGRPHLFVFFWHIQIDWNEYDDFHEIKELQKEIEAHEQIYKTFTSMPDLENQLMKQLDQVIPDIAKTIPDTPTTDEQSKSDQNQAKNETIGDDINLYCNRITHVGEFFSFYKKQRDACGNMPQFYFVYGCKNECPESLFLRLRDIELREHFKPQAPPRFDPIDEWPRSHSSFAARKDVLLKSLFKTLTGDYQTFENNNFQLTDLYQSNALKEYHNNVIVVPHILSFDQWDQKLMQWYIKDYWDSLNCSLENAPHFLLFFIITCTPKKHFLFSANAPRHVQKKLIKFSSRLAPVNCPIYLFDPLHKIDKNEVAPLFRKQFKLNTHEINKHIDDLFKDQELMNMSDIETYLLKMKQTIKKPAHIDVPAEINKGNQLYSQ